MKPTRQIALLRGINVGKAKRIAMADLRALVESLGYTDVKTLLNSGNIVFTGPTKEAAARIEAAVLAEIGVASRVTVLTASELAEIVQKNPLLKVATDPSRFLIAVLNDKTDRKKAEPLAKEKWAPDALALGDRFAYLWCADGILTSPLATAFNRALRDAATTRNWATILKLHAMASEEA